MLRRVSRLAVLLAVLSLSACASGPLKRMPVPQFQVGDLAIAHHFSRYPQYEGTHVAITGGLQWRPIRELNGNALRVYEITTIDGLKLAAQPFQLKHCPQEGHNHINVD